MVSPEIQPTDSGYPTPRDDIPSSSRSESPSDEAPMTSTPVRGRLNRPMKDHFSGFRHDLSVIESTDGESMDRSCIIDGVKSFLTVSKKLKQKERANNELRDENESLRHENESLREENYSLREDSRVEPPPFIPKLAFGSPESQKLSEKIKKEIISFIKNEEDRSIVEGKLEHMLKIETKEPRVYSATATIQVDADAQTEKDDHVNVINTNLKIEVDQLHSQIETTEKENKNLQNRLFDYEQLKAKFEENEDKLRSDLEKKLKQSQEKSRKYESKIEELELRLTKKRNEFDEVFTENRKLIDDRNTHDFEWDELKIQLSEVEKKREESEEELETLRKQMAELETELKDEKDDKVKVEKDGKETNKKLEEKLKLAIKSQEEAVKKLEEVQAENKELVKENEYLSQAQTALLDSETSLKNEKIVLVSNLRISEQKLVVLEENISEERRKREVANEEVERLTEENRKLEDEKQDANELLDELKKGKLEIDHLRQQMLQRSEQSEEIRKLQETVEETEKKLVVSQKREAELEGKIEGINSAKLEESRTKQEKIDQLTEERNQKETLVVELRRTLEHLESEFADFKNNANLQYHDEIGLRDQQIAQLHQRLVELETYPGKEISISKRNGEVQTDAPFVDFERNLRELMQNMTQLTQDCHDESTVSFIFAQFSQMLAKIIDDSLTEHDLNEMWNLLNSRMESMEDEVEERIASLRRVAGEEADRVERSWRSRVEELQEKLGSLETLSQERLYMAEQFMEQYQMEQYEKEEQIAKFNDLARMRDAELQEWETADLQLRERLERAEHEVQIKQRESLERNDEQDAVVEQLRSALEKSERDAKHRISALTEQLGTEQRKRAADKQAMTSMKASFETVEARALELKRRNTERQQLIDHMYKTVKTLQTAAGGDEQHRRQLEKLTNRIDLSGFIGPSSDADSSSSSLDRRRENHRRILSNMNQ